ncbi:MAG: hypothetical protein CME70_23750 [Halobacteriovorax sp.]|nr:hypothetical protein [Halobacteriovorax sp.]|tara:strand:- start:85675 stop:86904 length:1230 start_codon:yes stop_codon:yes gene_type:complete
MDKELEILWMIPKWTLPATDGARVATDRLLKNTALAGAKIDCLFVLPEGEEGDEEELKKHWSIGSVETIQRVYPTKKIPRILNFLKNFLMTPFTPLTLASFATKKVSLEVKKAVTKKNYDILVLDALHLGACFFDGVKFNWPANIKKVVLREHNFEQELWVKAAKEESFLPMKWFLGFQAKLVRKFENFCLEKVDAVAAISNEDLTEIKQIAPKTPSELVPLGLDFSSALSEKEIIKGRFLFIGKLDWPPNRDGLEWFLKNVWDEVIEKNPHFELQIVGSGNGSWLNAYKSKKGILVQGFIDDIDDAYKLAEYTLIPMRYGSGTRIKVIETYAKGRPIITTKMGIQGADLDESKVLLAETKEEWLLLLNNLDSEVNSKENFEFNRQRIAKKFDESFVGKNFYLWLKELL